jgi:Domain of unknown function (DUF6259)
VFETPGLRLTFDPVHGNLIGLLLKASGEELIKEPRLAGNFQLLAPLPHRRYHYVDGSSQALAGFEVEGDACVLRWEALKTEHGEFAIDVTQRFRWDERSDDLLVTLRLSNQSDLEIEEVWYRVLCGLTGLGKREDTRFLAPTGHGYAGYENLFQHFPAPSYIAHPYPAITLAYPCPDLNMQWVDIHNPRLGLGLYLGSHDETTDITWFHLQLRPCLVQRTKQNRWPLRSDLHDDSPIGLNISVVKLPYLKPGETVELAPICLHVHDGDWHSAADRYRRWMDTWMEVAPKPLWVQQGMSYQESGVFYPHGKVDYTFADMKQMSADALQYGVDTIHLIGWHRGGWDANAPDYVPADELGGWEGLERGVREVHGQGGRVCLFVNFQMADHDTDWYRRELHRYALVDVHGNTKSHGWGYYILGDIMGASPEGHKPVFTKMCPWEEAFQDLIIERFVALAKTGIDALSIDKLQMMFRCFHPDHTHRPAQTPSGLLKGLRRIRDAVRAVNPDISIVAEGWWDVFYQYIDASQTKLHDYEHLPVLKYTFPEVLLRVFVDRLDYHSVNGCIRCGHWMCFAINNHHSTLAGAPELGPYVREALRIRSALNDYLWAGRFRDTLGARVVGGHDRVRYGVHEHRLTGKKAYVIVNFSDDEPAKVRLLPDRHAGAFRLFTPFAETRRWTGDEAVEVAPARFAVIVEG